ncbi:hypothetical protein K474DRAFT_1708790 [Panus rudis PR-1116 ss-1]|nr:hypothetical protein K474DRAFT_1708790 [Panus rudis PR-1116 ss-1]
MPPNTRSRAKAAAAAAVAVSSSSSSSSSSMAHQLQANATQPREWVHVSQCYNGPSYENRLQALDRVDQRIYEIYGNPSFRRRRGIYGSKFEARPSLYAMLTAAVSYLLMADPKGKVHKYVVVWDFNDVPPVRSLPDPRETTNCVTKIIPCMIKHNIRLILYTSPGSKLPDGLGACNFYQFPLDHPMNFGRASRLCAFGLLGQPVPGFGQLQPRLSYTRDPTVSMQPPSQRNGLESAPKRALPRAGSSGIVSGDQSMELDIEPAHQRQPDSTSGDDEDQSSMTTPRASRSALPGDDFKPEVAQSQNQGKKKGQDTGKGKSFDTFSKDKPGPKGPTSEEKELMKRRIAHAFSVFNSHTGQLWYDVTNEAFPNQHNVPSRGPHLNQPVAFPNTTVPFRVTDEMFNQAAQAAGVSMTVSNNAEASSSRGGSSSMNFQTSLPANALNFSIHVQTSIPASVPAPVPEAPKRNKSLLELLYSDDISDYY